MNIQAMMDPLVLERFAVGLGCVEISLAAIVITLLLLSKGARRRKMKYADAAIERWLPVFDQLLRTDGNLPVLKLRKNEHVELLVKYWNRLFELGLPATRSKLIAFAEANKFDQLSRRYVSSFSDEVKILGLVTLGNMGSIDAYNVVQRYSTSNKEHLSIIACRTLLMIDGERSAKAVLNRALAQNWPKKKAAEVFRLVLPYVWEEPSLAVINSGSIDDIELMLSYLEGVNLDALRDPVRELLQNSANTTIIIAGIRFLGGLQNPADRELYTDLLAHESWIVRLRALHALKAVVQLEDKQYLLPMLKDSNSWVRHRSSQLLVSDPTFERHGESQQHLVAVQGSLDAAAFPKG